MTKKLSLETKIRDAAVSLSKVNSPYKAVSKQTSEQLDTANRKVELAQKELWKVSERVNDIYRRLLEHRASVLSFSVRSMESKQSDGNDTPSLVGSELLSGASTPISRNGSSASPMMSPSRKFDHFFAGHADSIVPQVPKKPMTVAEVATLEEKLQAATQNLNAANKKQAEMVRDLSLLRLEKDQVETSMEMEMQTAEETISALEKEISKLEDLDTQVRGFQDEKRAWEEERVELEERRQEVEKLERRLEVLEERSGEATEMERLLNQKDDEIARLKEQWEDERAAWQRDKQSTEDDSAGQLDEAFAALRTLIQSHGIMLNSRNSGSSLTGLVESVSSHLEGVGDLRTKLEETRVQQEESRKEVRFLDAQSKVCPQSCHRGLVIHNASYRNNLIESQSSSPRNQRSTSHLSNTPATPRPWPQPLCQYGQPFHLQKHAAQSLVKAVSNHLQIPPEVVVLLNHHFRRWTSVLSKHFMTLAGQDNHIRRLLGSRLKPLSRECKPSSPMIVHSSSDSSDSRKRMIY